MELSLCFGLFKENIDVFISMVVPQHLKQAEKAFHLVGGVRMPVCVNVPSQFLQLTLVPWCPVSVVKQLLQSDFNLSPIRHTASLPQPGLASIIQWSLHKL